MNDVPRSQLARAAAEAALVRVVHHYGGRPEFVVLGGLVPELLCATSDIRHAGTTDVDVQVDIEIAGGSRGAARLEQALRKADFVPDHDYVWRWEAHGLEIPAIVRFELLADLEDQPKEATIRFKDCDRLGAINLRGTGFAARDFEIHKFRARIGWELYTVESPVTGIAGFLLAKASAAYARRLARDWYDIAFVLIHNDRGGVDAAASAVPSRFGEEIKGSTRPAIMDLQANFADASAQGSKAHAKQMRLDQPDLDPMVAVADALPWSTASPNCS